MTNVQPGVNPDEHNDSQPTAAGQQADRPARLPCPAWCTTDHTEQDRKSAKALARVRERTGQPDYVPDWMARWHTRTVAEIPNPAAGPNMTVTVTLYRDDTLTNPDPDRTVVGAEHADCMSSDTAMKVALAIVKAAMVATGAVGGEPR